MLRRWTREMGTFYVAIQVADRFRERYVNVDAMVDTGSTYTSLPESLLEELGIEREETDIFEMADNRLRARLSEMSSASRSN